MEILEKFIVHIDPKANLSLILQHLELCYRCRGAGSWHSRTIMYPQSWHPISYRVCILMGAKGMLKLGIGWTMLAEVCEFCSTPLMRELGNRDIHCVSCERTGNRSNGIHGTDGTNGINGIAEDDEEDNTTVGSQGLEERAAEHATASAVRRQQSEEASVKIGQLMLQGYCLLEATCPNPSCYGVNISGFARVVHC